MSGERFIVEHAEPRKYGELEQGLGRVPRTLRVCSFAGSQIQKEIVQPVRQSGYGRLWTCIREPSTASLLPSCTSVHPLPTNGAREGNSSFELQDLKPASSRRVIDDLDDQ